MNNKEYTIKDLLVLLLQKFWIIIIVSILGGAAAFGYTKLWIPQQYSSHISMYVQSYTGIANSAGENQNNISNSKQLINTYIQVMKDDAVMKALANSLTHQYEDQTVLKSNFSYIDGMIRPSSLAECIHITSVVDTSALNVVVTTKNAELSAAICNILASLVQEYIHDAVGVGSINSIDQAMVYHTPVSPNILKNTILGCAAGFMLICLIIFLIDFFDDTVRSTDDFVQKTEKPLLGEIQRIAVEKERKNATIPLMTDERVPFAVVEGYKSIRANLMFSLGVSDRNIIVISSCNPGEGKSTTAANIAIAFAQTDSKVLLIDGDMRKPTLHTKFGIENKNGLSKLIIGKTTINNAIKKNVMDNLDIMPVGTLPPNPSELLASEQFGEILKQLSANYDYILIDSPPCNVASDSKIICQKANGMVFVLRYGQTQYSDVIKVMEQMKMVGTNVLGFVLNDIDKKRNKKYNRYIDDQYGYGHSSDTEIAKGSTKDD